MKNDEYYLPEDDFYRYYNEIELKHQEWDLQMQEEYEQWAAELDKELYALL